MVQISAVNLEVLFIFIDVARCSALICLLLKQLGM